jgi:cytochrome c biogenesis protein CcmG/thiol:disulfide interchange protein DsbE
MTEPESIETTPEKGRSNVPTVLSIVVAVLLLGLLALGLLLPKPQRPQAGDPAPEFALTLFDGSRVSLRELRGKIVVLNFWASWCAPCRNEAPALEQVWETTQDRGVVVLGVTYLDAAGASQAWIEEMGITFPSGLDPQSQISKAYAVTGVPETFLIDRQGNVAWFRIGELDAASLLEQIELLP